MTHNHHQKFGINQPRAKSIKLSYNTIWWLGTHFYKWGGIFMFCFSIYRQNIIWSKSEINSVTEKFDLPNAVWRLKLTYQRLLLKLKMQEFEKVRFFKLDVCKYVFKIGQENAENPCSILSDIKKAFVLPPNRGPPHRPTDDEPAIVHLHPFSYFVLWYFSGKFTSFYDINYYTNQYWQLFFRAWTWTGTIFNWISGASRNCCSSEGRCFGNHGNTRWNTFCVCFWSPAFHYFFVPVWWYRLGFGQLDQIDCIRGFRDLLRYLSSEIAPICI